MDVDAGEAWVDGERVPSLTDLEYRLLLLLYGRLGKICDKYQIVEAVWGQDYIDEVDDARVEKLISRLRSKIEHDPANPKYLITVRGRGLSSWLAVLTRPRRRGESMTEQILIVEDDLAMSSGIRDVLEMNGYRVQLAENGVEGLKVLETVPPRSDHFRHHDAGDGWL